VRRRAKSMLRLSAEARHPTLPVSVNAVSEDTREAPAVTLSPSDSRSAGVHRKKSTELQVTSSKTSGSSRKSEVVQLSGYW
jgi:hypothetical protein